MKYTAAHYAEALLAASHGKNPREQKEIAGRFLRLLARHRALPRLNRIMKEIARRERARNNVTDVEVQSASGLDEKLRAQLEKTLGKTARVRETRRTELLAGTRIIINEERLIDASGLRRLVTLFPKL